MEVLFGSRVSMIRHIITTWTRRPALVDIVLETCEGARRPPRVIQSVVPWECGKEIHTMSVMWTLSILLGGLVMAFTLGCGDSVSIAIDGDVVLGCRDAENPLAGGRVRVVATSGITYFDNIRVTDLR